MLPASTMCEARKPRRRRHDALANARRIDADDRRVLEDAGACPLRQRRKAMNIFAAVDLKRFRIIDAVEIARRPELAADAVDLPAFDFGLEILAQRLQPADQRFADIDIGNFQRAIAQRDARNQFFGRGGANVVDALLRQRPEFAGILEADALDQIADRKAISPASPCRVDGRMHSSRHGGPRARRRWRRDARLRAPPSDRQARLRPRRYRHRGRTTGASGTASRRRQGLWSDLWKSQLMAFSYGPLRRLSPCPGHEPVD